MTTPTPQARAALDQYAQELTRVGRGLILDDFRPETREQAKHTAKRIKWYVSIASLTFLAVFFITFLDLGEGWKVICDCLGSGGDSSTFSSSAASQPKRDANIFLAGWAFSLGGLGAAASIFLSVLKLTPQPTLRHADEFDVFGRLLLGCLFSTIFGLTVSAVDIREFHRFLHSEANEFKSSTTMLLLPFLAGYSIPLVLKILEKLVRAAELTIGGDDPRDSGNRPAARSGA
jgi:hypothetical protein